MPYFTPLRYLTCPSITLSVVKESILLEAPVIISYHPPVFRLPSARLAPPLCSRYSRLIGYWKFVWGGVNDWLAKALDKCQVGTLVGEKPVVNGKSEGRLVVLNEPLPVEFLNQLAVRGWWSISYEGCGERAVSNHLFALSWLPLHL
ncbi:hypothetical protein ARMSODRAFT_967200 [Armillaria solidipes]|uniref:Uncharacterized protein n=1 Tax=Armillaria solidipes TaxID=1076256 RepID=A0A2H3AW76_9AGAR|nr:hypothetical protein ARMSODRAFT_967200 [Armillaria solidipes]